MKEMGGMKAGGKRRKLSYLKNERNGRHEGGRQEAEETGVGAIFYSAFQIDELHRHNQSLVGTLHNKNAFHVAFAYVPLCGLPT